MKASTFFKSSNIRPWKLKSNKDSKKQLKFTIKKPLRNQWLFFERRLYFIFMLSNLKIMIFKHKNPGLKTTIYMNKTTSDRGDNQNFQQMSKVSDNLTEWVTVVSPLKHSKTLQIISIFLRDKSHNFQKRFKLLFVNFVQKPIAMTGTHQNY